MKKIKTILSVAVLCYLGIASSCNGSKSTESSEEKQQATQMETLKDSLEVTNNDVDDNIKGVKDALKEVDNQF